MSYSCIFKRLFVISIVWSQAAFAFQQCNGSLPDTLLKEHYVLDKDTGIVTQFDRNFKPIYHWLNCPLGSRWENGKCHGNGTNYVWSEVVEAVNGLVAVGYDDWRLPEKEEFRYMLEMQCTNPATDKAFFKGVINATYWTNTIVNNRHWIIDFSRGEFFFSSPSAYHRVLLIRPVSF